MAQLVQDERDLQLTLRVDTDNLCVTGTIDTDSICTGPNIDEGNLCTNLGDRGDPLRYRADTTVITADNESITADYHY